MPDAHANFPYSTVAVAPSPASTGLSLSVQSGEAARFPATPFNAPVVSASANPPLVTNSEIIRVTNISGDTLTIVRQQEGTSARAITVGDQIFAGVTKKTLTDIELVPVAASADATPAAGQLVLMTGAHNVFLPATPTSGAWVGAVALTGTVTVLRQGGDSIRQYTSTGLTQITVPVGTYCLLTYLAGVWYVVDQTVRTPMRTVARMTKASGQAIALGANTKLNLDTATFDPGSNVDTGNHRYTAPIAGYYQVNALVTLSSNSNIGQLNCVIYKNGGALAVLGEHANSIALYEGGSDVFQLAAGDYLELWYYASGTGSPTVNGAMSACLLEAA